MRTYTVTFFNSDDTVSRVDTIESSNDDVILDEVGSLPYRHAVEVHEGERLVGRSPPMVRWRLHS